MQAHATRSLCTKYILSVHTMHSWAFKIGSRQTSKGGAETFKNRCQILIKLMILQITIKPGTFRSSRSRFISGRREEDESY